MTKVPSLDYPKIISALRRDEMLKLTVPAHRPVKRSTLAHIFKHARLSADELLRLL